jgi:PAS domain S-box-containing protein
VVVAYGDITDRKRAEEALRESEERYRLLAETTRDIIVLHDMEGRILYVNQAGLDFAGFDRSEAIGRSIVGFVPAEHQADIVARGVQRAAGDKDIYCYETEFVDRAGQRIPIEANSTPVLRQGQMSEILVVARDITERKRAEAELKRSNRELEHFAYAVSHDLREPLRMVSSFLALLDRRSGERLDDESREFLDYALDGAERLQAMIRGLLELSRVTRRARDFAPVDCETVLAQTLHMLQISIAESGAKITHDPLPMVWADELQMGQLFQNLIGNALKFRGPEAPRVHISAECQGEHWCFAVQDNGIGLDPAQADYILGVFQRLHTRDEYPGIGLGLTICKKIVERHGGCISVESEPGHGATFYFTIPAYIEEVQ